MVTSDNAPKKESLSQSNSPESRVSQPQKMRDIAQSPELSQFSELISLMGTISDRIEQHHEQFAGVQDSSGSDDGSTSNGTSAREVLLKSLPSTPVMQRKLTKHIEEEIRSLRKEAKKLQRSRNAGWAHDLTQVFARIRRLSGIARSLFSASVEAVKKFYVLVFIDRQSLENQRSATTAP